MALAEFKPEIWASSVQSNLDKSLVYAQSGVVNTSYEGNISQAGDTVHINSIGRVSVSDYSQTTGLSDPETLTSYQQSLLIDQQKSFNFMIDDIDMAQTQPKLMSEATSEAAYALADVADQYVAGLHVDAGKTIGSDGSPVTIVAQDPGTGERSAYGALVDLSVQLSSSVTDANGVVQGGVPTANRWVVVDPEFHGKLRMDNRFVDASRSGSTETLRNGEVGRAAGFRILVSNNVPTVSGTPNVKKIIAGHPMGWTYAEQINKTEAYRPDKFFSDALRGLHLYGAKVIRPEALAVLTVDAS
ncbi:hypothetical protein [Actinopolyspora halophila]|uniref:phage major capsid protein n=1 Tax=Actinopolyspora halophila TaxID=1850 RepID=UPI000381E69A|nr:hypothetical protein [Actinopolyspora halophila]